MQVSFTSVIPVNVYINGQPSTDKKHIQQGCKEVVKVLAGPVKDKPHCEDFIKDLSQMDAEYSANLAWRGYCLNAVKQNGEIIHETPSDYFKIIFDEKGKGYVTTGTESDNLSNLGRQIGIEMQKCNKMGYKNSYELTSIKNSYWRYISSIIHNPTKRLKNEQGQPMAIDVFVSAQPIKRNGKDRIKVKVMDLGFSEN